MGLNKGITNYLENIIDIDELLSNGIINKNKKISVFNIFEAEKNINIKKNIFCKEIIKELQKTLPNLKKVIFVSDLIGDKQNSINFVLYFQKDKKLIPVVLNYNRSYGVNLLYNVGYKSKILVAENKKYYEELANYGIENNLNDHYRIRSLSNDFSISFKDEIFEVGMMSRLMQMLEKYVYISYCFNQSNKMNVIKTEEGNFNLTTNVLGIKNLLSSSKKPIYFCNEKINNNNTLTLLKKLYVSENDIPEYLKEEISKVKVLKK